MAGRRRGPAAASAIDLAGRLFLHHREQQESRRARAEELYYKFAFDRMEKQLQRESALTQFKQGATIEGTSLIPKEYTDPVTGVKYGTPDEPKMLPAATAREAFSTAQPGRPLPQSSIGSFLSPEGRNTMNVAIERGVTESPSVEDPIAKKIEELLKQGVSEDRIKRDLKMKGIDPADYGLF